MALNALIVLLLVQGFGASRAAFDLTQHQARLMDRGRFVRTAVQQDLLNANGRLPCAPVEQNSAQQGSTRVLNGSPWLRFDTAVWGIEAPGTGVGSRWRLADDIGQATPANQALPATIAERLDPQSDVLIAFHRQAQPSAEVILVDERGLTLTRSVDSRRCAIWLVSDCSQTVIFQDARPRTRALQWTPGACIPGNAPAQDSLGAATWPVLDHVAVYAWRATAWFVGRNDHRQRVLYRASFRQGNDRVRVDEMVRGVETLQVEYGVSRPATPLRWHAASEVNHWPSVRAVRFGAVVSTEVKQPATGLASGRSLGVLSSKIQWANAARWAVSFDGAQALYAQNVGP